MKLVFIIDNGRSIGGGDYAQFKFAEHLALRGHKVNVFAANYNAFFKDMNMSRNLDISVRNEIPRIMKGIGRINRVWDRLHTGTVVESYLKKNKVDYLIGYLKTSAHKAVQLGKKYNIQTANFIFENPTWMKEQLGERFDEEYKGRFKRSWEQAKEDYMETDILIPNSHLTRAECMKWLGRDVSEPVYPGIDRMQVIRQKRRNQIIYVGRLNAYKNIDEIIRALSTIENPPKLVIVGTGEEEHALKRLAHECNVDCEFKGSLSDKDKWIELYRSKFMVFPSSFEGFGMPPAEAMAAGIPCICSDIPILREVYKNSAVYFIEHDIDDLKEKIEMLIKDTKKSELIGKKGKEYVKTYSWKESAKKIEVILK